LGLFEDGNQRRIRGIDSVHAKEMAGADPNAMECRTDTDPEDGLCLPVKI